MHTFFFALIEWESSEMPTLIVGETRDSVIRKGADTLEYQRGTWESVDGVPEFHDDMTGAEVEAWFSAFNEVNTVPSFMFMSPQDVDLSPAANNVVAVAKPF